MSEKIDSILTLLKGFSFDSDTGRTINDLYSAVSGTGCTKDTPFVMPWWVEGEETPAAVNSFLDPDGRRVHVIWRSDASGLSQVIDVIFDAPSLAKPEREGGECDACSIDMMKQLSLGEAPGADD